MEAFCNPNELRQDLFADYDQPPGTRTTLSGADKRRDRHGPGGGNGIVRIQDDHRIVAAHFQSQNYLRPSRKTLMDSDTCGRASSKKDAGHLGSLENGLCRGAIALHKA